MSEAIKESLTTALTEYCCDGMFPDEAADAAVAALRAWLEAEGLVCVPSTPTREMLLKAGATPDGVSPRGGTDYLGTMLPKYYAAMISAAPDALREGE